MLIQAIYCLIRYTMNITIHTYSIQIEKNVKKEFIIRFDAMHEIECSRISIRKFKSG